MTASEKLKAIEEAKVGSVTDVANKYKVSRQAIYNWMKDEDKIREEVGNTNVVGFSSEDRMELQEQTIKTLGDYEKIVRELGGKEELKRLLGSKVTVILMNMIQLLETHPSLNLLNPKDLSRIIVDMNDIRKQLFNEPDIIIEYKNRMMADVLIALREFLNDEQIMGFARRMEAIQADYEIVDE